MLANLAAGSRTMRKMDCHFLTQDSIAIGAYSYLSSVVYIRIFYCPGCDKYLVCRYGYRRSPRCMIGIFGNNDVRHPTKRLLAVGRAFPS